MEKTDSSDSTPTPDFQQLLAAMEILKPLTDFHRADETANEDDLRMSWDVRLVRGKDTPYQHVKGTCSLPSLLAPKMIATATSAVEREIHEKILMPMAARLQSDVEATLLRSPAKGKQENGTVDEADCFDDDEDEPA